MAVDRLGLAAAEGGPVTDDAFEWTESRYDTRVALEQSSNRGFALPCVWSHAGLVGTRLSWIGSGSAVFHGGSVLAAGDF